MDGTRRQDIRPGLAVEIVLKQDQASGKRTRGIVRDILTSSPSHPHGIKVRLDQRRGGAGQGGSGGLRLVLGWPIYSVIEILAFRRRQAGNRQIAVSASPAQPFAKAAAPERLETCPGRSGRALLEEIFLHIGEPVDVRAALLEPDAHLAGPRTQHQDLELSRRSGG